MHGDHSHPRSRPGHPGATRHGAQRSSSRLRLTPGGVRRPDLPARQHKVQDVLMRRLALPPDGVKRSAGFADVPGQPGCEVVVGLRGLEPLTSSLSAWAGAAWRIVIRGRRAWTQSMAVQSRHVSDGREVQQLVRQSGPVQPGEGTGRATDPIASPLARRRPGARVAEGHREATRSALAAGRRRANPRRFGRRLGGEWAPFGDWPRYWRGLRLPRADYVFWRPRGTSVARRLGADAMPEEDKALVARMALDVFKPLVTRSE
jgi:hypothetical protein